MLLVRTGTFAQKKGISIPQLWIAGESPAGEMSSDISVVPVDLTGLEAWLPLKESGGDAIDAHTTGRNFTEFGSVGSTDNSRTFNGNVNNYFESTNATLRTFGGGNFYITCWVYFNNVSGTMDLITNWETVLGNNRIYRILLRNSGVISFWASPGSGVLVPVDTNEVSAEVWYFVEVFYRSSDNTIGIALK